MATKKTQTTESAEGASRTEQGFEATAVREEAQAFGALSDQPKVKIRLPLIPGDTTNQPLEVFLNGVPYFILRGATVEVPEDIAALLGNAGIL